jgi:hypothetical protein
MLLYGTDIDPEESLPADLPRRLAALSVYDAFISYSHAGDGQLAPAVQRGLQRFARPWNHRQALRIFRDQTGLAVTPALWTSIQQAMNRSRFFVLLASPESANSVWVNNEVTYWLHFKSAEHILPVLTDGELVWDRAIGDFDFAASTALPRALRGAFTEEPRHLDLRWAREETQLNLRHSRFRDAIAEISAPLHGTTKDELESQDIRQHRRARRLWTAAIAASCALLVFSLTLGSIAIISRNRATFLFARARQAETQASQAQARVQAAEANVAKIGADAIRLQNVARDAAADARRQMTAAGIANQTALSARQAAIAATGRTRSALAQAGAAADLAAEKAAQALQAEHLARDAENRARDAENRARDAKNRAREAEDRAREAKRRQWLAISETFLIASQNVRRESPDARRYNVALLLTLAAIDVQSELEPHDRDTVAARAQLFATLGEIPELKASLMESGVIGPPVVSHNGELLAVQTASTVKLFDVRNARLVRTISASATSLAFSHDDMRLAIGTAGAVILWDTHRGKRMAELSVGSCCLSVDGVAFSADSALLVAIGRNSTPQEPPAIQVAWDLKRRGFPIAYSQIGGQNVTSISTVPSQSTQMRFVYPDAIRTMDLVHHTEIERIQLTGNPMAESAFSQDGQMVAIRRVAIEDIEVWDMRRGRLSWKFSTQQLGPQLFPWTSTSLLAVNSDGSLLLVGTSSGVVIYNRRSKDSTLLPLPRSEEETGGYAAFVPYGAGVVTVVPSADHIEDTGSLMLWNPRRSDRRSRGISQVGQLTSSGPVVNDPASGIRARTVDMGPTEVHLVDIDSGRELGAIPDAQVLGLRRDGLVTREHHGLGNDDTKMRLWELNLSEWRRAACMVAQRDLRKEEWRIYGGGSAIAYRRSCLTQPAAEG